VSNNDESKPGTFIVTSDKIDTSKVEPINYTYVVIGDK
jgi:hypothetical protein